MRVILDLRKIDRIQGEITRAKMVLSEGEVSEDTSREEKPFATLPAGRQARLFMPGDERALRKSSKGFLPLGIENFWDITISLTDEKYTGITSCLYFVVRFCLVVLNRLVVINNFL